MTKVLPSNPNLEQLKKQAKDLLKAFKAGDPYVCEILRYHFRFARATDDNILKAEVTLQEIQHGLALEYGFKSWKELKVNVGAATTSSTPPSPADVQWFFDSCATGLNSGEPLLKTLRKALNETSSLPLKEVITAVGEHVERGGTLSEAFAGHPLVFNETCVAMTRTGETLGTLGKLVTQIAKLRVSALEPNADLGDVVLYATTMLYEMQQSGVMSRTIKKSEALPIVNGWVCDFGHLVNRIKIMSGVDPVSHQAPVTGRIEMHFGGTVYAYTVTFNDRAEDPSCDILLEEKEEKEGVVITGESIVTELIHNAVAARASDIHMEWINGNLIVKYRIDGRLQEINRCIPENLQKSVIAAIKQMADLDVETDSQLQSGRIITHIEGKELDLRVSVMPYVGGESAVLRLLVPGHLRISLDRLGLTSGNAATIRGWTQRPNGMFFVSGPTGSGKTTTLYSMLMEMNPQERKIITCEDPVEHVIDGINQQQVDISKGITFHNTIREIMKQDPDVIMVGEIRDRETFACCVEMAHTGHLVLSSLHTPNASAGVRRLLDIGIETHLISSTLIGVMAQRLVRVICDNCREEYKPEPEVLQQLSATSGASVYKGRGCEKCGNTGYRGRTGILEMLEMNDALRGVVEQNGSPSEIREQAISSGMIRMREDGLAKVAQGITSIDEVLRVTAGDIY